MTDEVELPLDLQGDLAAVRVLRLARELVNQAASRQSSDLDLHRMQSVVTAWSGVELVLRCIWQRVDGQSKDQHPNTTDVLNRVVGKLRARKLRRPVDLKSFQDARNATAHTGSEPSATDTRTYVALARDFTRELVRATWDANLELLSYADLVRDPHWRHRLRTAEAMLRDPDHVPLLDDQQTPLQLDPAFSGSEHRRSIAVGLARHVRRCCYLAVHWDWPTGDNPLEDFLYDSEVPQRLLEAITAVYGYAMSERRKLRGDVLALALGIRLPNLRRFEDVCSVNIGRWDAHTQLSFHSDFPSEDEAQFAVRFVVDFVLRAEEHLNLDAARMPGTEPEPNED